MFSISLSEPSIYFDINQISKNISKINHSYNKYGVIVLKNYFRKSEKKVLRDIANARLEVINSHNKLTKSDNPNHEQYLKNADLIPGDIFSFSDLAPYKYIFFKESLINVLKSILKTNNLLYFSDSNLQLGEGLRGFHKDNVVEGRYDKNHSDWYGLYELVRCAFYFEDHCNVSGGIKVRLKSHLYPNGKQGKIYDIKTKFGDLVIWNLRTTHSGNNKVLKNINIAIHPKLEDKLPKRLFRKERERRIAAFCVFGREGKNLDDYIESINSRKDYQYYFLNSRPFNKIKNFLESSNVKYISPNDYIGEEYISNKESKA